MRGPKTGSRSKGPTDTERLEQPFDRWLSEKLQQLYGGVVDEPLPDEMVDLVKAHEAAAGQPKKKAGPE